MALDLTALPVYDGDISRKIYSDIVLGGVMIEKGGMEPFTNVKNLIRIPSINGASGLQADDCTFSPVGNLVFTDKELRVCSFKINQQICWLDLETKYTSQWMNPGANTEAPASIVELWVNEVMKYNKKEIGEIVWQGDAVTPAAGYLGLCTGLIKQFTDNADTVTVNIAAPTTAANLVANLNLMYNAIPEEIMNEEDLAFYLPLGMKKFFHQAITSAGTQVNQLGININGDSYFFYDIQVIFDPGMPANNMVVSFGRNFLMATDLISDIDALTVINMHPLGQGKNIRLQGSYKFGVGYRNGAYVVWGV